MNIWYFNHYAGGPGIGKFGRAYHLSRAWAALGHQTTIFVARFHHLLDELKPLPDQVEVDGVKYVALNARRYTDNGFSRVQNMADFCYNMLRLPSRIPSTLQRPDAIILSSAPPYGILPASRLAKRFSAQLTFEVRDLWPLSLVEINGSSRLHPFVLFTGLIERFAYRNSDLVASLLGGAEEHMLVRGLGPNKFVHVPNGLASEQQSLPASPTTETGRAAAQKIKIWKEENRIVIIHPGAQGVPNALDRLLDAIASLNADGYRDRFAALLVGNGGMTETLKEQAKSQGATNVAFFNSVPNAESRWLTSQSDIGYSGKRDNRNVYKHGTSFNKTIDFMQAGIPIVLPIHAPHDPIALANCGIVTGSDEPAAIANALRAMIDMTPQQRVEMGAKGKTYVADTFSYDTIARNYIDWIEKTRPSQT
ncbi:MAG: glycosyltransferase WbuB [Nitrobacter sp.]|uniref:glycosyltransferase family 4 protein n=1 Tax=Nitrobacter sp. TaxID=29420 RepID=UPI00387DE76D